MDNLTHSLVGAALAQAGLKRKTAMAMPTLIIAANIPDIDATCTIYGIESLAMRRGLTHGPIALLVLPILLTGLMILWDRWRRRSAPDRPAVHAGWLLALAYIGTISHPALDWLNNYGIRLLEPFSSEWFYGDTLFIIDVWILAMLGSGVWLSLRRERRDVANWQRPAKAALACLCLYIFGNGVITGLAERQALTALRAHSDFNATSPDPLVVANPMPLFFWEREMLWRDDGSYGQGHFVLGKPILINPSSKPHFANPNSADNIWPLTKGNKELMAFLFWSRMPVATMHRDDGGYYWIVGDQRFGDPLVSGRFSLRVPVNEQP
jgi:inner membrane protein